MMSISTTLFGEISHASLFFTGQLRNSWQMLTEPWGSAEPRLKNTGIGKNYAAVNLDHNKEAAVSCVKNVGS